MTTKVVDTSFINSFVDGNISRENIVQLFKFDTNSLYYRVNYENYKEFINNLVKLTHVIKNNYYSLSDNNKKVILELIETYLVYYFNYFRTLCNDTEDLLTPEAIGDAIDATGYFIARFHYKIKYYDLRDLSANEFNAYILMEEGIAINNQYETTYNQIINNIKPSSNGVLTDKFNITRGEIHQIIDQIKKGLYDEASKLLVGILNDNKISSDPYGVMSPLPRNTMTEDDIKNALGDDIEILYDDESNNCTNKGNESVIPPFVVKPSTDQLNEESVEFELTENNSISGILKEYNLEDILKDYAKPWEFDINEIMKTIVKYMDIMYQSAPEETKKATTVEIKSMLYIMSFIKFEKLV
jgi:hypothetical protein